MRRLLAPALLALATPAAAQESLSDLIAREGLRATEAQLAALPSPTPDESFALGGVRFLGGIERALQLRYRVGLTGPMTEMSSLPVLRLPLGDNPAPEPFDPAMIDALFQDIETDMAAAIETLSAIQDSDEVAVEIDTSDLWFDIDGDGARAPGEGMMEIVGWTLSGGFGTEMPSATIRFDTADAAWLSAYAHLLSAASDTILALGPSDAIARVLDARASFESLGLPPPMPDYFLGTGNVGDTADLIAMFIMSIEGQPDPERTRAARDHLLAMVQDNRRFWSLVPRETDNDREWIPNKNQQSATGLPFPPDTGARWLAVLADAEGLLKGDLLIPFWRVGPGAGLDLNAFLENPPELDIAGMIQGATFAPYLRTGRVADGRNMMLFTAMVGGDSPLYVVMLN